MQFNDDLAYTLKCFEKELAAIGHPFDGDPFDTDSYTIYAPYVIFGSASLVLRGIIDRAPGDIDIMTSKWMWGQLFSRPLWYVETPNAGDPPMLVSDTPVPMSVFYDWSDRQVTMHPKEMIRQAEIVDWREHSLRVVKVDEALRHKQEALNYGQDALGGEKWERHVSDIEAILEEDNRTYSSVKPDRRND